MRKSESLSPEALARRYAAEIANRVPLPYQAELEEELTGHILDSAEAEAAKGVAIDSAVIRAAEHLGDPKKVARSYRRTYCAPKALSMHELFCVKLDRRLTYGAKNPLEVCLYIASLVLLALVAAFGDQYAYLTVTILLLESVLSFYLVWHIFRVRKLRRSALTVCGNTVTQFTYALDLYHDLDAYIGYQYISGLFDTEDLLAERLARSAASCRQCSQAEAERRMQNPSWLRRLLSGRQAVQVERWYNCAFTRATRNSLYFTGSRTPGGYRQLFRIPNVYRTVREKF